MLIGISKFGANGVLCKVEGTTYQFGGIVHLREIYHSEPIKPEDLIIKSLVGKVVERIGQDLADWPDGVLLDYLLNNQPFEVA